MAWSPLGSGFLTGTVNSVDKGDFRQNNPRYAAQNLARNRNLFAPFMDIAKELNVTPAQLSLAWLLHQGQDIIPIPGTRRFERVDENADDAPLTAETILHRLGQMLHWLNRRQGRDECFHTCRRPSIPDRGTGRAEVHRHPTPRKAVSG